MRLTPSKQPFLSPLPSAGQRNSLDSESAGLAGDNLMGRRESLVARRLQGHAFQDARHSGLEQGADSDLYRGNTQLCKSDSAAVRWHE